MTNQLGSRAIDRLRAAIAAMFSRLMRTRFAHRFLLPLIPPAQMRLYKWTGGRFQLSALLMPSLVLISTGAKSGQRRETPLACWPQDDGTWLIAGSNWGKIIIRGGQQTCASIPMSRSSWHAGTSR